MPRRLSLAPWTHQPPELVDITSDASLRNGLTSIALPWGVLRPNARGQTAYASGSTISGYVACRDGLSIHFGTADSAAGALLVSGDLAFETVATSRYNTTRIAIVERRTSGTTRRAISATAAAGAGELLWRMESGATPELVASGVALVLTATSSFSAGDRHVIGMRLTAGASNTTWSHWRNGVQLNAAADTTALTAGSAPHIGGVSGSTNAARSDIGIPLHINWSRALSDTEMRDVMLAVWQRMLAPRRIWVPVSAGGAADLTLADASHAHAADSLSLTTASTLTIADATHAHTAEALSLTTASTLAVADALHDHAAEGLALTTESLLALQDALHDHAADAPELLSGSSLLIAEALQAHTADGLALVVDAYLTVANAGHGHTADALVLTVPSTGADPAAVWSYVLSNGKTAEENVVEILAKLQALHDIHGLTLGSPLTVSATARAAGTISQTISSSSGTTTVTRTS